MTNLQVDETGKWKFSNRDELKKLVYLHGGLYEALRLFPPVALQHKAPIKPDILPSGHKIKPNTKIVLSFYSMVRTKSIWGEDCLEFKPERWISEQGQIKHEPSFKFTAFNAGPRSCLGKEMSFVQIKTVVASIISSFRIQVVKSHAIAPCNSVVLHMKHSLKVTISRNI
ncbi:alkane hydroxylase MAH1-like [Olea europaea subsp. europaea]|uniref:Alkane hydroxylase MAH1-like n=1 Tax=Olea europaea subsp. europaea TaxID=158383 RepID=A0A8S0Q3X8_OLEEU|nr:alkane hydroxylase MAH1-like [Olea europaea subsp. europaea]